MHTGYRLGLKDDKPGQAGSYLDTQKWESVKAAGWAWKQEVTGGHCGAGDRNSRDRVKVRPWTQAAGELPRGKTQPKGSLSLPMLVASRKCLNSCSLAAESGPHTPAPHLWAWQS